MQCAQCARHGSTATPECDCASHTTRPRRAHHAARLDALRPRRPRAASCLPLGRRAAGSLRRGATPPAAEPQAPVRVSPLFAHPKVWELAACLPRRRTSAPPWLHASSCNSPGASTHLNPSCSNPPTPVAVVVPPLSRLQWQRLLGSTPPRFH